MDGLTDLQLVQRMKDEGGDSATHETAHGGKDGPGFPRQRLQLLLAGHGDRSTTISCGFTHFDPDSPHYIKSLP